MREQGRMCNVRAMAPRITSEHYGSNAGVGVREVDGLEIRFRIPITDRPEGDVYRYVSLDPQQPEVEVPRNFETTIIDAARGRAYELAVEVDDDGAVGVVGFAMDTAEGSAPVRTAGEFCEVPFNQLLRESLAAVALRPDGLQWRSGLTRKDIDALRRPRGGRARIDDERLTRVAELHREATEAGEATSKHVARALQVTPENARRLILLARDRGFLPRAGKGV